MADRIAELAHTGQQKFNFDDMFGDGNMKAMMIQAVAEMLDRRDDLAEARDHYLGIAGQSDFTVTAKPTQEMKHYCPLVIQAEPQIYETDWDAPYEDDLELIPSSCACGCEDEINASTDLHESNISHSRSKTSNCSGVQWSSFSVGSGNGHMRSVHEQSVTSSLGKV